MYQSLIADAMCAYCKSVRLIFNVGATAVEKYLWFNFFEYDLSLSTYAAFGMCYVLCVEIVNDDRLLEFARSSNIEIQPKPPPLVCDGLYTHVYNSIFYTRSPDTTILAKRLGHVTPFLSKTRFPLVVDIYENCYCVRW